LHVSPRLVLLSRSPPHSHLHSFPTRRSSDLAAKGLYYYAIVWTYITGEEAITRSEAVIFGDTVLRVCGSSLLYGTHPFRPSDRYPLAGTEAVLQKTDQRVHPRG